jgi:hypothetical protein
VVALEVADAAEHRVVRAPGAADEVQQREGDRDADAPEHSQDRDAEERRHRQHELRAPPSAQAPRAGDVDEAQDGDDHDRCQTRGRHVVDEPGADDEEDEQDGRAGEPRELAAGADVLGDRGARAARGEREPLEQAGRDVRDAQDSQLLVLVDVLAQAGGVAAREDARVGERDEGDPDRGGHEGLEVVERHRRHVEAGQARGDVADDGQVVGEAQDGDQRGPRDDRDEDAGDLRRDLPQAEDQHERPRAEGERRRVCLVEPRDEVADRRDEALAVDREPEQLRQLIDDDGHGDAHQVAEAHGRRQQLGHEAEARQTTGEHDRPHEEGEHPGERDPLRLVARGRQRDDRRSDER